MTAPPRFLVTAEPLALAPLLAAVSSPAHGAVVGFLGVVRAEAGLTALTYEAYPAMAERSMAAIAAELAGRFGPLTLAAHHRVGRLAVGEVSLALAVGAPHRREACLAAAAFVDRLKEIVPIWKTVLGPGSTRDEEEGR